MFHVDEQRENRANGNDSTEEATVWGTMCHHWYGGIVTMFVQIRGVIGLEKFLTMMERTKIGVMRWKTIIHTDVFPKTLYYYINV